jgi:hypothetical protein
MVYYPVRSGIGQKERGRMSNAACRVEIVTCSDKGSMVVKNLRSGQTWDVELNEGIHRLYRVWPSEWDRKTLIETRPTHLLMEYYSQRSFGSRHGHHTYVFAHSAGFAAWIERWQARLQEVVGFRGTLGLEYDLSLPCSGYTLPPRLRLVVRTPCGVRDVGNILPSLREELGSKMRRASEKRLMALEQFLPKEEVELTFEGFIVKPGSFSISQIIKALAPHYSSK